MPLLPLGLPRLRRVPAANRFAGHRISVDEAMDSSRWPNHASSAVVAPSGRQRVAWVRGECKVGEFSEMGLDHVVEIRGEKVRLRPFAADDAEAIHAAVRESLTELGRWLSWCREDYSLQDTCDFLDARTNAFQTTGEHSFAILELGSDRFVGAIGINQIDPLTQRANLGYWLRTSATGRGYAAEAARLLARWALLEHGLERLEIVAATGNVESQRVAAAIGATREGIARRRLRVHGVQHDAVVFSLIRADF